MPVSSSAGDSSGTAEVEVWTEMLREAGPLRNYRRRLTHLAETGSDSLAPRDITPWPGLISGVRTSKHTTRLVTAILHDDRKRMQTARCAVETRYQVTCQTLGEAKFWSSVGGAHGCRAMELPRISNISCARTNTDIEGQKSYAGLDRSCGLLLHKPRFTGCPGSSFWAEKPYEVFT